MSITHGPSISTHVLDTERGEPAVGVPVALFMWQGGDLLLLAAHETDPDGRITTFLDDALKPGSYQLAFDVAAYFRRRDDDVAFLSKVVVEFHITDNRRHYHVPLLLSRYSCSSYRGS